MKKLIGTAMLAALLATSAFAELSIGGGAMQLWSPVAYNGDGVRVGMQNPWGGGRSASVSFTWVSEDGKAGSQFAIVYDPWDSMADDGNRIIWVKPWDFLKLTLGHWDGINDIQVANTASWSWIRPGTWLGFNKASGDNLYCENEDVGAMFEITPIEDLMVRVGLPFDLNVYKKDNEDPLADDSYHMFEALRADVEYTITDIAKIMVGWRGGRAVYKDGYKKADGTLALVGELDVYANVLAVENLQLEVGTRINIWDDNKGQDLALVGARVGYNIMDNFAVKGDFAIVLHETNDPRFAFGVGVEYGLTDSLSLDADFRALIPNQTGVDPTFSFLAGLKYACSTNATVGIGFQGKTNGGDFGPLDANSDNFGFAVPILVNVSF